MDTVRAEPVRTDRDVEAIGFGLPPTLRAWGLDPAAMDIPQLVEDALKSRNIATNPRPIGPPELTELYRAAQG